MTQRVRVVAAGCAFLGVVLGVVLLLPSVIAVANLSTAIGIAPADSGYAQDPAGYQMVGVVAAVLVGLVLWAACFLLTLALRTSTRWVSPPLLSGFVVTVAALMVRG